MAITIPLVYPDDLPTPQVAPFQSTERRALSGSRPFQARALQRDRLATQQIVFPPLTFEQATRLRDWWRSDLEYGGNWFLAPKWPRPQGIGGVRQWLGPLRFDNVPPRMVRVTGACELRGLGMDPLKYVLPLLAMHFSGNFTDESGHLIAPHHWINPDAPPTIQVADPKFGGYMFSASTDLPQPLLSDIRGPLNLNEFGEWQCRFWVKLNDASVYSGVPGGYVWVLQGATNDGSSVHGTPGGSALQVAVRVDGIPPRLGVSYNGRDAANPSVHASATLVPLVTDSEVVPADDEWHFIAVCGDATSTRAYIDENLVMDDRASPFPAGSRPVWYEPTSSFVNQVFIVGGGFSGGIGDGGWPSTATFTNLFVGGLDDLQVTNGPGSVEFTGSTISVPLTPF